MLGAGSLVPMNVTRLPIGWARPSPGAYPMDPSAWHTLPGRGHARQFHSLIGVNPLQTTLLEHGIVSGRVALLLRSAEIQPSFSRFVKTYHPPWGEEWSRVGVYNGMGWRSRVAVCNPLMTIRRDKVVAGGDCLPRGPYNGRDG